MTTGSGRSLEIPSFSLSRQNAGFKERYCEVFAALVDKGEFILGQSVKMLEANIADYCGVEFGIGVANGSDALYLSLFACGVGPGDEVITTPFTFFATAGSIARVGAKPVFVDIDPITWNIDASKIEERITTRTKAIVPVHLYGCPADMESIMEIARKFNLTVIEDAAQALGAMYCGKMAGSIGDAGCVSFFPTKNLGAFGDGGMVLTNNPEMAEKLRLLRVHGAKPKYYHQVLGCNSRLDEMQAAILNVKFPYLDIWNRRRREIAELYHKLLAGLSSSGSEKFKIPEVPGNINHVYHQYTIQSGKRDKLKTFLEERGVGTAIYYPLPLHLQKVFEYLGYQRGEFPVSEEACQQVLSLPMFPELKDEEVCYVADLILSFFEN